MAFIILFGLSLMADPPEKFSLWPSGAPGEKKDEVRTRNNHRPKKQVRCSKDFQCITTKSSRYFPAPEKIANGTAVLVCPGGGYNILAFEHEGVDVCKWLNSIGVTCSFT